MNSEIINKIHTEAEQSSVSTTPEHAQLLSFPSCPEEYKSIIEDTSLEKLVYWKLNNLFSKLDKDAPTDILKTVLVHVEKPLFALVLKSTKGNQSKAAEVLGCNRNTLHRKLKEFSIEPSNLRRSIRSLAKKSAPKIATPVTSSEEVLETR